MKIDYNAEKHFFVLNGEIVPHVSCQDKTYEYSPQVLRFFDFIYWVNGGAI